ncbi:alpha/beta hydrolase family protein [Nocardia brasiliensis]|uniref:alpha/beta hydrolase family protein n=1 Tax=Nocardia brasiliensis TaxID=37326 RepID=UPI00189391AB|nr:hypothetical protein [Nocardia brasiliensis]MBF6130837.1 hypothetical protein [Nocardia brasiliensis]
MKRLLAAIFVGVVVVAGYGEAAAAPLGVPVLPPPTGVLPVGTTALHLVDPERPDPFRPELPRELMVSVFYPATAVEGYPRSHYVSKELIPGLEQQFGVQVPGLLSNSYTGAPVLPGAAYPVVLYSPGAGVTRMLGTGLAEDLASRGYVVVTIDHTYEAPAVEFPGGRFALFAPVGGFTKDVRQKYSDARLLDTRLVLDSLARLAGGANPDAAHRPLPAGLDRALDLEHIGMVGHSLGGFTAVESMYRDRRLDAAVDLDGQLGIDEAFGRAAIDGVDRPVLVLTSQQAEGVGDAHPSLDAFWEHATGWKRRLTIRDSAHYDYTDMAAWVPAPARAAAATYIGPIPGDRATVLVRTYVAAMFDKFLRLSGATALDRAPTEPEITVIR